MRFWCDPVTVNRESAIVCHCQAVMPGGKVIVGVDLKSGELLVMDMLLRLRRMDEAGMLCAIIFASGYITYVFPNGMGGCFFILHL